MTEEITATLRGPQTLHDEFRASFNALAAQGSGIEMEIEGIVIVVPLAATTNDVAHAALLLGQIMTWKAEQEPARG